MMELCGNVSTLKYPLKSKTSGLGTRLLVATIMPELGGCTGATTFDPIGLSGRLNCMSPSCGLVQKLLNEAIGNPIFVPFLTIRSAAEGPSNTEHLHRERHFRTTHPSF